MDHVQLLIKSQERRPALIKRVTGQFYTPYRVAKQIIEELMLRFDFSARREIRVIDPFCGDGRLLFWLIDSVTTRTGYRGSWNVTLWDIDSEAVRAALQRLETLHNLDLKVSAWVGNTFVHAPEYFKKFDIVITNPPWERLKPDRRELCQLSAEIQENYKQALRDFDQALADLYPESQPIRKFAGWGTNLAHVGAQVALELTNPKGVCALVAPTSLLADQNSVEFRRWVWRHYQPLFMSYFPAEAKLFAGTDQPVLTLLARPKGHGDEDSSHVVMVTHDARAGVRERLTIQLSYSDLEELEYTIPVGFGGAGISYLLRWRSLDALASLEGEGACGLWLGRELDETNIGQHLRRGGKHPFVKGRLIKRFETVSPELYVDTSVTAPSVQFWRVAWRDVSRPTQKRRLQASLVPPNWVCGNSVHVGYFRDGSADKLKVMLAYLNSLVIEFQVRARLSTAHISLGAVRKARIPRLTTRWRNQIVALVDRRLAGDVDAEFLLEALISKLYGLDENEWEHLICQFPKLSNRERGLLLRAYTLV